MFQVRLHGKFAGNWRFSNAKSDKSSVSLSFFRLEWDVERNKLKDIMAIVKSRGFGLNLSWSLFGYDTSIHLTESMVFLIALT